MTSFLTSDILKLKYEVTTKYEVNLCRQESELIFVCFFTFKRGEGTIRKRSDGRWKGRYVNCIGETKSIYGKNKNEVRNKLKNVIYDYNTNAINHQEIRGDITLTAND